MLRFGSPNRVAATLDCGIWQVAYTRADRRKRLPIAAWALMVAIAICCNLRIGYGAHRADRRIFLIAPIAVSIAFFLISDIDSPRRGAICVAPQNLLSLL